MLGSRSGANTANGIAALLLNQQKALRMEAIKQQQSAQQQARGRGGWALFIHSLTHSFSTTSSSQRLLACV
jgi:hypothetical protein